MTNTTMPRSPPRLLNNDRSTAARSCLLLIVEGVNDIEFLRRISRMLHQRDTLLPDLGVLEREGRIVFIPFGGGNVAAWATRLMPLGFRELHIYDREVGAETHYRISTAKRVNSRPGCHAFVLTKRSLENYLHPAALATATGIDLQFNDNDAVAELVAKERFTGEEPFVEWDKLSRRTQKRFANQTKRVLNTRVVEAMTPHLLSERDRHGEVVTWMRTVASMMQDLA